MELPHPARARRIVELDGVRALAILGVLYWHCFAWLHHSDGGHVVLFLERLGIFSWGGVDLFFVLSGFLIGGILLDNLEAKNLFRVFYIRRVLRIFPLYYGWLFVTILVLYLGGARWAVLRDQFSNRLAWWVYFLHLQNFGYALNGKFTSAWLAPTWSLAVEEQFYLILPALLWALKPRLLIPLAIAMMPVSIGLRWWLLAHGHVNAGYVLLPARADSLILGLLGAWSLRQPGIAEWIERRISWLHVVLVVLVALCFLLAREAERGQGLKSVFGTNIVGITSLVLIFVAIYSPYRAVLRWPVLTHIGNISYGVYLFHYGFYGLAHEILHEHGYAELSWQMLLGVVGSVVFTMLVARLSFVLYESRFIRMGHHQRYAVA
jgi:peptidoglycan/LPS O-acetylase OafA/YrhL